MQIFFKNTDTKRGEFALTIRKVKKQAVEPENENRFLCVDKRPGWGDAKSHVKNKATELWCHYILHTDAQETSSGKSEISLLHPANLLQKSVFSLSIV